MPRIRMLRTLQHLTHRAVFYKLSAPQNRHTVSHRPHHAKIMRNQQHCHSAFCLNAAATEPRSPPEWLHQAQSLARQQSINAACPPVPSQSSPAVLSARQLMRKRQNTLFRFRQSHFPQKPQGFFTPCISPTLKATLHQCVFHLANNPMERIKRIRSFLKKSSPARYLRFCVLSVSSSSVSRSSPRHKTLLSLANCAPCGKSRATAKAKLDLPEPDSPTIAKVSPSLSPKDTESKARTTLPSA